MKIFKKMYICLLILITLIAFGMLLYPSISNYINNKYAVSTIVKYEKHIENIEKEEINKLLKKASIYNSDIAKGRISKSKFKDGYMLGYVDIPKINIKLPIYEGTSNEVLKKGVGVKIGRAHV